MGYGQSAHNSRIMDLRHNYNTDSYGVQKYVMWINDYRYIQRFTKEERMNKLNFFREFF